MALMTPAEAEAYRQSVLDALGGDDALSVQETEPELWARLIGQAGAHLRTRPEPGEWSVLECLGHMTDFGTDHLGPISLGPVRERATARRLRPDLVGGRAQSFGRRSGLAPGTLQLPATSQRGSVAPDAGG